VRKRSKVRAGPVFPPFLGGLLVVGVLAWLGWAYQLPHSEEEAVSLAGATLPVTLPYGDVEITAWASREVIRAGDTFEVWLLVKNVSGLPLSELAIKFFASPGFVPVGTCWRGGVPGCRPGMPAANQPVGLEATLAPDQTGMVFAELKSAGSTKGQIKASIAWVAGGKPREELAAIDPVRVLPRVRGWVTALYSLLKDLGLPLLVGVLAFIFQRSLQERSRVQTVRNALLPTATANAVNYLLPVVSAIAALRRFTKEAAEATDAEVKSLKWQQSFYYFVFLIKRMRDQLIKGGAIFLEDTDGEEIVIQCWVAVYFRAVESFGYLELSQTVDLMDENESFSLFMKQFPGLRDLLGPPPGGDRLAAMRFRRKFLTLTAAGGFNADLGVLGIMEEILQLEVNRLFLGWYERIDNPSAKQLNDWKSAVAAFGVAHPEHAAGLAEKLDKYIVAFS
jgi:hypothetical protein